MIFWKWKLCRACAACAQIRRFFLNLTHKHICTLSAAKCPISKIEKKFNITPPYYTLYSSTQIIKKCIFSKVQNVPISTAKVAARNVVLNNESCGNLKLKKNISPNQSSKPKFRSEEPAPSDSGGDHRRRIITEEKSKVVAAAWGRNLLDSLPR